MQFLQCDDLLDPAAADDVERAIDSHAFPWYYYRNVNYAAAPPADTPGIFQNDGRFRDSDGFASLIFPAPQGSHPGFESAKRILETFLSRHGIVPKKLIRIKANLLLRSADPAPLPFLPHVDLPTPHWAMIYYVNDSDGDTIFLDKTYPDWQNAAIVRSVSPRRNRAIFFDGRYYHAGTCPARNSHRIVLNFNFQ